MAQPVTDGDAYPGAVRSETLSWRAARIEHVLQLVSLIAFQLSSAEERDYACLEI